jgi:UDP-N-acetylglucosamine--N-acetylmuramyl-(pentapeptide) pyrophosphoryl-undecaprenol N-acetylglucosamine transferase
LIKRKTKKTAMNQNRKPYRLIISGGGTGGHIFPALSIADKVKELSPDSHILFVGALGKMEMERVPAAGYQIVGLPIIGFPRKLSLAVFRFFINWMRSLWQARRVIRSFMPDAVIGVGGFASAPVLQIATRMGIPAMIQEQNSYAGIANKSVARQAARICVAYPGMERFFPAGKIILTGNPIRSGLINLAGKRAEAFNYFGLDTARKVVLITGGSLGAGTLNRSVLESLDRIRTKPFQLIWQSGKYYYEEVKASLAGSGASNVFLYAFLDRMDLAFAAADIIVSRAGAGTISELCLVGKPCVLVPSPNVAEDHQTKNALSLADRKAAILVPDAEAPAKLFEQVFRIMDTPDLAAQLSQNISKLAIPDSSDRIVAELFAMIEEADGKR